MLSAADLDQIRQKLQREPTDVEIAAFENLWSEHCSYRSTRRLLKTLPTTGENVLLGPGDDAAIVRFSDNIALAVGMESHNHPSYVDPYNGAATGIGGMVRDVLSMGARPIALMDPLYFGPPDKEKNRYLLEHVVAGAADYGNCIGVPVVRGDLAFDSSFDGNPLVNVVCVGIVSPDRFITARVKQPGNHLVLIGAATGRDGLGGASFASRDLAGDSGGHDLPSAQVGDPYIEKRLIEAILEMAGTGKVRSCRDLGAAGLAGASSEMCSTYGGLIHADRVHQREPGMRPVEIMLAESQERMLIEVAPGDVPLMGEIAAKHDLMWADVGEVIAKPRYIVRFHGRTVCDLPVDFLCGGVPECTWAKRPYDAIQPFVPPKAPLRELFLSVLSHPEVASRAWVAGHYEHDVQMGTVVPGRDAAVLRLGDEGLAFSCGCNPRHIYLSPSDGTANAVYENAANLACVGAEPLCIVNCLNFASPVHPEISWQIAECVKGMGDMARMMGTPIVGGNVSLYNESDEMGTRIKPTPSIGMVGRARPRRWPAPGEGMFLALAGTAGDHFGGSVLDALTGCCGSPPPRADPDHAVRIRNLVNARADLAVTDLSQGGLAAALATLCPGARVDVGGSPLRELFSETYGRFLIAYHDEKDLSGVPFRKIGKVIMGGFDISGEGCRFSVDRDEVEFACSSLTRIMRG